MNKVIFGDIVKRVNYKVDKDNTDLEYYIGGQHFDSEEITLNGRGVIKGSTIGPMFYFGFKTGDVLFVTRNPHLRKAAIANIDGVCSEKTFVLGTKDEAVLLQIYLPFILQTNHFWNYANDNKSGSVNFFVNWSTLANYEFNLPDIPEQERLSKILWAAEDVKKSSTSAQEDIKTFQESMIAEWLIRYNKVPLREAATITAGQSPVGSSYNDDGLGMPFYQGKTSFAKRHINRPVKWTTKVTKIALANDILMSVRAPVGPINVANEKCCIGRGLAGIRAIEDITTSTYLYFILHSLESKIATLGVGTTFKAINKRDIEQIIIPLPDTKVQNALCRILSNLESQYDLLDSKINEVKAIQRSLFDSLEDNYV